MISFVVSLFTVKERRFNVTQDMLCPRVYLYLSRNALWPPQL